MNRKDKDRILDEFAKIDSLAPAYGLLIGAFLGIILIGLCLAPVLWLL